MPQRFAPHSPSIVRDNDSGVLARPQFSAHAPAATSSGGYTSEKPALAPADNPVLREPLDSIVGPIITHPSAWAGPRTAAFLCGCAGVAAMAAMGFHEIGAPVLGLPAGAWLIGATVGVTHVAQRPASRVHQAARSLYDLAGRSWSTFCGVPWTGNLPRRTALDSFTTQPLQRLRLSDAVNSADRLRDAAEAMREASARAAASLRTTINDQFEPALSTTKATLTPNRRHAGPVRVNVSLDASCANLLLAAAAGRAISEQLAQWESNDPAEDCGIVLDGPGTPRVGVLIFQNAARELVIEPVRRGRGEDEPDMHDGWEDWSLPLPMGYAGVFPLRLDATRVTIAPTPGMAMIADGTSATLIVALAEAAGELTRNAGRYLDASARTRWQVGLTQRPGAGSNDAMRNLATALSDRVGELVEPSRDPACRAAARVLSAWAVSCRNEMSESELLSIARLAAGVLPGDTHAMLRLAAAEYAAGDERTAERLLVETHGRLRRSFATCTVDPLAYIMAELELGTPGPLTLGRIAAGVALLWATSPDECVSYLHDDLIDDLNDAGRFGEKSREIEVLRGVIAALDAARLAEGPVDLSKAA